MKHKGGFTLIELLVVIAVIAILLGVLIPALNRAREIGKRAVCLANLKGLQEAWELYVGANDDRIVNGEAYGGGDGKNGTRNGEPYWCGDDQKDIYGREHLDLDVQKAAIMAGALYSYCSSTKLYHCPTGIRGEIRNYAIVDSMNGKPRSGVSTNGVSTNSKGVRVGNTVLWIKNKMEITSPTPSARIVFGDEGMCSGDSIATYYDTEKWWDPAQVRHSNGNTYSFADGHAEYWKWDGRDTIDNGRKAQLSPQLTPTTEGGFKDLYKFQQGVWGRLGYPPTHALN
jgi:prepilin-type N-terminal cleavage/methylation domain-containing protein/prepilin-type processing-associated H-X9-DG protein